MYTYIYIYILRIRTHICIRMHIQIRIHIRIHIHIRTCIRIGIRIRKRIHIRIVIHIRRAFGPEACWRTSLLFLGYTPLPPSRDFGCQMCRAGPGQNYSRPLGTTFCQFVPHSFCHLISGNVFHQKTSKNSSKIKRKSHYFTTLRRLVFRVRFGKVKNLKIGVSSTPYAHFRGFRGSKNHSKTHQKHPKILKNGS